MVQRLSIAVRVLVGRKRLAWKILPPKILSEKTIESRMPEELKQFWKGNKQKAFYVRKDADLVKVVRFLSEILKEEILKRKK